MGYRPAEPTATRIESAFSREPIALGWRYGVASTMAASNLHRHRSVRRPETI